MLNRKRFLYVGFMCLQAVEKILKACYLCINIDNPPYIHNLRRLAKLTEIYEQMSEEQKDFIDRLNPLNIEARYPTYKENLLKFLNVEKCTDTIDKTKELHNWNKHLKRGACCKDLIIVSIMISIQVILQKYQLS